VLAGVRSPWWPRRSTRAGKETLALFRPPGSEYFDREACAAITEVAEQAGAGPFVGLDLYTEVIRPGWRPFPVKVRPLEHEGES
jgi:hypothetical protein